MEAFLTGGLRPSPWGHRPAVETSLLETSLQALMCLVAYAQDLSYAQDLLMPKTWKNLCPIDEEEHLIQYQAWHGG
jgi:hypothetical protein